MQTSQTQSHNNPDIKMVALDLDGTVVDDDLNISDRTLKLLKHLIDNTDVRVVVATGRMHPSALPFARQIGTPEPLVSYQGAMIRTMCDEAAFVHHSPIPMDIAEQVLTLLKREGVSLNLYVDDRMFTNHGHNHATRYARISGITPIQTDDLHQHLTAPPSKMMAIDDERIDQILSLLQNEFEQQLTYCRSRPNFCEIINVESSKWNALKILADSWGLRPDQVMAIGDQENDISMIEGAGVGVAMGQAPGHVKAVANIITGTIDEDGACQAIEEYVRF